MWGYTKALGGQTIGQTFHKILYILKIIVHQRVYVPINCPKLFSLFPKYNVVEQLNNRSIFPKIISIHIATILDITLGFDYDSKQVELARVTITFTLMSYLRGRGMMLMMPFVFAMHMDSPPSPRYISAREALRHRLHAEDKGKSEICF